MKCSLTQDDSLLNNPFRHMLSYVFTKIYKIIMKVFNLIQVFVYESFYDQVMISSTKSLTKTYFGLCKNFFFMFKVGQIVIKSKPKNSLTKTIICYTSVVNKVILLTILRCIGVIILQDQFSGQLCVYKVVLTPFIQLKAYIHPHIHKSAAKSCRFV